MIGHMSKKREPLEKKKSRKKAKTGNGKLLLRFLKGSIHLFVLGIACSAVMSLADMITPQIIRMAIDNAIGSLEPDYPDWVMSLVNAFGGFSYLGQHLILMALALVAVALIRAAAQYGTGVFNNKGSETLVKTMRDTVFRHIQHLPFSWHMKNHTGDIIQRCTSDIDKVRNFVAEQLTNIIRIVVLLAFSIYFMMRMHVGLALIAISVIPLILGYVVIFGKKLHKGFEACDETEGEVSAMVQENLTGVRVVRAFARERYEKERFEKHNNYYCSLWVKLGVVLARFFTVQDILSMLQMLLVVVFGSVLCVRGRMTAGDLVAFISYNAMLAWPVRRLGRMLMEMSKADVSIGRIGYIMNSELEEPASGQSGLDTVPFDQEISFEHVSFAYENCPEILHDISFTIQPGTTVGILGATGSGKSTLMLLLDKMYDLPEGSGCIKVGGKDIREIDTAYLRRQISMVLQEPFLFSRTIAENIGIAGEDISPEEIREASRAACLHENVEGFTKGYDTFVGERGVTLSGGQKQRTAIARALTAHTPILVFDDSLSAVDTETDARIRASLQELFGTATIIIITHRLTTIAKADQVIVLEDGRVSEIGTPSELRTSGGPYQQIYELQSGGTAD